jgi:DNA polymerase-1
MIKMTEPSHAVVLFDGEHENPRTELLGGYKANRVDYSKAPEAECPFSQLADIYGALDCMGIRHSEIPDGEADDAIAAYTLTYGGEIKCVVASFDSDFYQLINENVTVLRYRGKNTVLCNEALIQTKLGILPGQYADFKALTGDCSDNIRGAEHIGPKTAAALLRQFGDLRAIIRRAGEIARPSIRASVQRNAECLRRNYRLIKLDNTAAIPFALHELEYCYDSVTTFEVLERIGLR